MRFGLENLFIFGKFSDFYCTSPGAQEGGQGAQFPWRRISHNSVISTFFNTLHFLPKDLGFEHGGVKLVS